MKVERHLMDDDIVLFGRQPSLHKMSLMALRIQAHDGSTYKLNLATTTPYNADFDGDEMNMYVPQTEEARAEAYHLMKPDVQINDPQDKSCIGLKQDSLLGSYLCTSRDILHTREEVISFAGQMLYWKGHELPNAGLPRPAVLVRNPSTISNSSTFKSLWTGKQCASMTLPSKGVMGGGSGSGSETPTIDRVTHSKGVNNFEMVLKDEATLIDRGDMLLGRRTSQW